MQRTKSKGHQKSNNFQNIQSYLVREIVERERERENKTKFGEIPIIVGYGPTMDFKFHCPGFSKHLILFVHYMTRT